MPSSTKIELKCQDVLAFLDALPADSAQCVIADPPYFRVLQGEEWDQQWTNEQEYIDWSRAWVSAAMRVLKPDGLLYCFGQPGKREQAFLPLMAWLRAEHRYHDLLVWDRVLGYRDRKDSFAPQYEMALVLARKDLPDRKDPYFDKDATRLPYDEKTIRTYLRDKRYKDRAARQQKLEAGKPATAILRFPSLKGASHEKAGHPAQKPLDLIEMLVLASSRPGDLVVDPFVGCGTTVVAAALNDRDCIANDKDPAYIQMTVDRLQRDLARTIKPTP